MPDIMSPILLLDLSAFEHNILSQSAHIFANDLHPGFFACDLGCLFEVGEAGLEFVLEVLSD